MSGCKTRQKLKLRQSDAVIIKPNGTLKAACKGTCIPIVLCVCTLCMYVVLSPLCSAHRPLLSTWAASGDTLAYAVGYDDRRARRRSAGGRQWSWKLGAPAIGCAGVAGSADGNHGHLSSDVYDAVWLARVLLAAQLRGKGWLYI